LAGIKGQAFLDIDSLLRPVYGHAKIAGKQVLRKGLSPLATTISAERTTPVIAGMRLPAGKTGSGKGAGRMVAQAIATARGPLGRARRSWFAGTAPTETAPWYAPADTARCGSRWR